MYTLHINQTDVVRDADGAIIPPDPDNTDYQAYQAWVAEGHVVTGPDLAALKARLLQDIDGAAEATRLKYITAGAGMVMTYREKFDQAQAVEALGQTAANALNETERTTQFPTLAASVGIEAGSLWDCAQLVIGKYETFAALSNVIEKARLQGKKNVSDASTAAEAQAAYEAITWPSP